MSAAIERGVAVSRSRALDRFKNWARFCGVDISEFEHIGGFRRHETAMMCEAFIAGINDAACSMVTVPIVTETNWIEVNEAARGGG